MDLYMNKFLKVLKLAVISRIIGRLKDHKSNMLLRPIISKCSGPNNFLEKAYVPFLKQLRFTIKSTEDFIQKLKQIQ